MTAPVGSEIWEMPDNLDGTRRAVELAETRARLEQKKTLSRVSRRNEREFAQALHREADQLYHNGDYETALVLYHRAANIFPRDSSHSVAARRTAATISSWNNPSKALRKLSPNTAARLDLTVCPETAAIRAADVLSRSPNVSSVSEALRYFDGHKHLWKKLPQSGSTNGKPARTKIMLRQLNSLANMSLKNLQAAFHSGKMTASLKIAEELLTLSSGLRDSRDYQITAYRYLALIHVSLKRHDRAVAAVARLLRLSRSTGNTVLVTRSLVILGKVHLAFGHLHAAAIAWENTAYLLTDSIPLAWIRHEIGRCYLETGRCKKSLEMARICIDAAAEASSSKWTLRGNLLLGQSLIKLGRFAEALHELKVSVRITEEEGDTPMLSYVRSLIDRVTVALRAATGTGTVGSGRDHGLFTPTEGNSLITTVFSHRGGVTECQNESSDSTEVGEYGEEITMYSRKRSSTRSLYRGGVRSDLTVGEEKTEEMISQGGFPLGLGDLARISRNENVSSLSYPRSVRDSQDIEETNLPAGVAEATLNNVDDEPRTNLLKLSHGSSTSLNSNCTSFTYVVAKEQEDRITDARTVETMEGKGVKMLIDKPGSEDFAEACRMIEQLHNKNEQELLEMLKDMILTTEQTHGFSTELPNSENVFLELPKPGNPTEREFSPSKSCQDRNNKISVNHGLYRYSLPSSPRNCEADKVSHTCEGWAESARSD